MKRIIGLLLLIFLATSCFVPAFAVSPVSVFAVIPDDYYIHFFGGAALTGWLENHGMSSEQALFVAAGVAIGKELFDSAVLGGSFDVTEAALTVLGSMIVSYL